MNLSEALLSVVQQGVEAGQPTDLRVGTVTAAEPLEITMTAQMAPLRRSVLALTSAVVEKKIPVLAHTHQISGLSHQHAVTTLSHSHTAGGDTTSAALAGSYDTAPGLEQDSWDSTAALAEIACIENGRPLPVENGYMILNRALATGDKVLMLRVQHGQKYVVLSRIFEEA